jgi:hypothetical protein
MVTKVIKIEKEYLSALSRLEEIFDSNFDLSFTNNDFLFFAPDQKFT